MEQSNVKYELLALSKNESSDESEHFVKKKKLRRTRRAKPSSSLPNSSLQSTNGCFSKFCMPLLCSFFLGITIWVFGLTWAATQLRIEMQSLRNNSNKVAAGNVGIPESIQKCHSLTRQLEKNQTKIINQLQRVAQRLTNFSNMISGIQADLSKVEKKLDESPPQLNVPNSLQTLTTNVASFRDQIDELQSKADSIADEQGLMKTLVNAINKNVTLFYNDLQDLKKHSTGTSYADETAKEDLVNLVIGKVKPNITAVNTTLWLQLKWLSDDVMKAQKIISNLTDESAFFRVNIETIHSNLKSQSNNINLLRSNFKNQTYEWNEILGEAKALQSNFSNILTSCLQCKYLYNEEPTTGISAISSASEMSNATSILSTSNLNVN